MRGSFALWKIFFYFFLYFLSLVVDKWYFSVYNRGGWRENEITIFYYILF